MLLTASAASVQAQIAHQITSTGPLNECVPTDIKVHLNISKLPYQTIRSRPGGSPHLIGGLTLGGRTVQPYGVAVDWELDGLPMRDGKTYCGRIESVTLTAGQQPPSIWISPELKDECLRDVALEHEREHVSFFYDYLDDIEAALPQAIAPFNQTNSFMRPEADLMKKFKVVIAEIRNEIQSVQTQAVERLERQNANIDTLEAYDRSQSVCK